MASEQVGAKKKQSRNPLKSKHCPPVLYRHQDCIPDDNLLKSCEIKSCLDKKSDTNPAIYKKPNKEAKENSYAPSKEITNNFSKTRTQSFKETQDSISKTELTNDNLNCSEEFSKSRRRRLRKRKFLKNNSPALPDRPLQQKPPTQPVAQSKSTVSTGTTKSSDQDKSSLKEQRKRLDKSASSRNKTIKTKTFGDQTIPSKVDLIKTLEGKTLNSLLQTLVPLTNSSPGKQTGSIPVFSFPEKKYISSPPKAQKDDVFYFGETKHQLEKLASLGSEFGDCSLLNRKTELAQSANLSTNHGKLENCTPSFNFSNNVVSFNNSYGKDQINPFLSDLNSKKLTFDSYKEKCVKRSLNSDFKSNLNQGQVVDPNNVSKPSPHVGLTDKSCNLKLDEILGINSVVDHHSGLLLPGVSNSGINIFEGSNHHTHLNMKPTEEKVETNKSREEIMLEREAKKAAKLAAKAKSKSSKSDKTEQFTVVNKSQVSVVVSNEKNQKHGEDAKLGEVPQVPYAEAKDKINSNNKPLSSVTPTQLITNNVQAVLPKQATDTVEKSKAQLKAERRAKQEAQRAAKANTVSGKTVISQIKDKVPTTTNDIQPNNTNILGQVEKKLEVVKGPVQPKPKLFSHLYQDKNLFMSKEILPSSSLHPAIVRLGIQYSTRVVVGSNARCVALLHALKQMINDYSTPSQKEFSRGLEEELKPVSTYLNQCRPLAVSMINALRHIKRTLTQLPNIISDLEAKRKLCEVIDTYIHEQIDVAGKAICDRVLEKIADGDVILTYGCSSLVYQILVESHMQGTKFKVVIVDGLPWREGKEMLRRLVDKGLSCTYVLITGASFIMREASKVLLGAHALLANGCVMSRAGSSQVALLAHCNNVPVLVCCETHKFSERVQTDAFVYNELGELCCDNIKEKGRVIDRLTPLSLAYDITPPDLVSAVVTERAVLPCTSVPVILRIKPSESAM